MRAHAYAVFPTIGEGAFIVGGEGGKGGVFVHGLLVGEASLAGVKQGSAGRRQGLQRNHFLFSLKKRALDEFESGDFEFGADASVTAVTASADASANTNGEEAGVSGGEKDARTAGHWYKGMAVFHHRRGRPDGSGGAARPEIQVSPAVGELIWPQVLIGDTPLRKARSRL